MASRLRATATISGTGDCPDAGGAAAGATGLGAPSTVDLAWAATSFAAPSWPLVSIRCCTPRGCSVALGGAGSGLLAGAFLAGAFLAGAFLAGAFFAAAFLAGAFFAGAFLAALAGGTFSGGVAAPSGSPLGWSCGSAMRPLLCSFASSDEHTGFFDPIMPGGVVTARRAAGQGLRRTAHTAAAATRASVATANGHTGRWPPAAAPVAAGPGVPVPGTVRRNDHE